MSMTTLLLLGVSGVFAGIVNTLAGGGSFVSLAALIFIGLPADMANATNRVATHNPPLPAPALSDDNGDGDDDYVGYADDHHTQHTITFRRAAAAGG